MNYPLLKDETFGAITLQPVPSFAGYRSITKNEISGLELCTEAPLIESVTIITELVGNDLRSTHKISA